jgi:hypothetical protein
LREQNPPLPLNEELSFKIIKMNEAEKRIGLTVVSLEAEKERQRLEDYQRQAAEATHQIEEALTPAEPEGEAPAESETTPKSEGASQE